MRHVVPFWRAVKQSLLHKNVRTYASICNVLACTHSQVSTAEACSAAALESRLHVLMATTTHRCECKLPKSCKCESSGWRAAFMKFWPHCTIDDLYEGTNLETHGKELNFGMFVVRNGSLSADDYYSLLANDFDRICKAYHPWSRKAVIITKSKKLVDEYTGYESFQCSADGCGCKYEYEKVKEHKHYKVEDWKAPTRFVGLLNRIGIGHQCSVNEVVANGYTPTQRTPPHHDYAALYSRCTSIVSASFGNPGLFAWRVRPPQSQFDETTADFEEQFPLWDELGGPKRGGEDHRNSMIKTKGYAGVVPLFHGDLLVMEGTMQTHFEHYTVLRSSFGSLEDLLAEYPATIQASKDLLPDALSSLESSPPEYEKRLNLTTRFISNHNPNCCWYVPAATRGHSSEGTTAAMDESVGQPLPVRCESRVQMGTYPDGIDQVTNRQASPGVPTDFLGNDWPPSPNASPRNAMISVWTRTPTGPSCDSHSSPAALTPPTFSPPRSPASDDESSDSRTTLGAARTSSRAASDSSSHQDSVASHDSDTIDETIRTHPEFCRFFERDSDSDIQLDCNGRVLDNGDEDNPNRQAGELQVRWNSVWHSTDPALLAADAQVQSLNRYLKHCIAEKTRYEEESQDLIKRRDAFRLNRRNRAKIQMNMFIRKIGKLATAWNHQECLASKYKDLYNSLIKLRRARTYKGNKAPVPANTWMAYLDLDRSEAGENTDKLWMKGTCANTNGAYLRILVPLRTVAEMFAHADLGVYSFTGNIQVDLDLLSDRAYCLDHNRWLKAYPQARNSSLRDMFGRKAPIPTENKIINHIEFGTIEFSWNYDKYMSRLHLQTPTSCDADLHREFLDGVLRALRLTKHCQFLHQGPPPTDYPFKEIDDMPVVLWMRRAHQRQAVRQRAPSSALRSYGHRGNPYDVTHRSPRFGEWYRGCEQQHRHTQQPTGSTDSGWEQQ